METAVKLGGGDWRSLSGRFSSPVPQGHEAHTSCGTAPGQGCLAGPPCRSPQGAQVKQEVAEDAARSASRLLWCQKKPWSLCVVTEKQNLVATGLACVEASVARGSPDHQQDSSAYSVLVLRRMSVQVWREKMLSQVLFSFVSFVSSYYGLFSQSWNDKQEIVSVAAIILNLGVELQFSRLVVQQKGIVL